MAEEGSRKREEELRQQLDQVQRELSQERSAKKQLHHDKVRDMKAAKEKEQAAAKEQMESLKLKLQREKNQELQSLRDSMTKDFKSQLKSLQRKHEEEQVGAQKEWRRERQELKQKLQREVQVRVEQEMTAKFEAERRKLMREMFQLESQRRAAEERMADLVAADHSKAEAIRELGTQHRIELEKLQRSMRTGSRQQLEELEETRRRLGQKDQEMGRLTEQLQRAQADRERAEEDLKRIRQAESWARASPRATSPTLSPNDSTEEVLPLQLKQPYSKRERDMLIRNSELTFRVRQLEEKIGSLGGENKLLQGKLEEAESSQRPLKEQAVRQSQRINELNATLRSREKQVKQLSQENLELKGSRQHLEEECDRLRRNLTQQMSQSSVYRAERAKLMEKNRHLSESNMSMSSRVEALEEMNMSLQRRLTTVSLPTSPRPFTPLSPTEDEFGSQLSLLSLQSEASIVQEQLDQLEFEKEESQAKYEELKGEYVNVREHYKELKEKYVELQSKGREQQAVYRQVQQGYEQLKKEKLSLEHEVSLLRERGKEAFDVSRQQVLMYATQEQLQSAEQKLREMEDFVIEQDEVARYQEASFTEERQQLMAENRELRVLLEQEEGGASRETEGAELRKLLQEHQDQSMDEEDSVRTAAPVLLGDSLGFDETHDAPLPAGLSPDMQQWAQHCLQENGRLKQKLHELQFRLDGSVQMVGELQGTLRALEGELVEEHTLHLSMMEDKEEEVLQLKTEVSHMESKLTRMRRAITVGVTQQMSQQLGHKATSAIAKMRHAAMVEQLDIGSLLAELKALESVIYELLQTIFPGLRDFDTPPPTITEVVSQTPPTITKAVSQTPPTITEAVSQPPPTITETVSQTPPTITEAVSQTPPTITEAVSQPPPTITETVSQTPPTITEAVSQTPPTITEAVSQTPPTISEAVSEATPIITTAVLKAPPTTVEAISDIPLTITQFSLEEELLLEPEEPPTPPSSPVPNGYSAEQPLLPGNISQLIQPLVEASPPLPLLPMEEPPQEYDDRASLTSVSLTPSFTPSPPPSLPPSPPPSPPPSEEAEILEQGPPTLSANIPAPDMSKSASLHITGEPSPVLPMLAALQTSIPLTVETAVPMSIGARLQVQLEDHPPSPVHSVSPPPSPPPFPPPSLPPHEDTSQKTVEAMPILPEINPPTEVEGSGTRLFLVVMDYDPHSLCTSGRPDLELTVPTGAIIAVHGDMDDSAYYSATFEGRTGLVPANFVQEMALSDSRAQQRLFNQTLTRSLTPSLGFSREATPTKLVATPTKFTTSQPTGSPAPPSGFKVETALGTSVLLVCWQAPPTDASGKNNGVTITGYQLYVNGEPKTFVDGASQTKALLAGLDLSQPQSLGIATCSREGKNSDPTSISYMDHVRPDRTQEPQPYRMFVALYDYDPLKCSPSDNPEFELELKEGSLVKVFGQEMADGFLVGELNSRRGLVPATFVTEVSGPLSSEHTNQASSTHSDTTTLLATSKKMVASFDYMPTENSPNVNPDLELRFNKGEIITVFGNMDRDGFYCGELKGMFGLVPSNFLEEWEAEEKSSPEPPSPLTTECPTPSSHRDSNQVRSTDSSGEGPSVPEHLTNEEGPPPLDLPVSQPATGKGGPSLPEPPALDSSKKKGKKRGRGFSFGKDWVKSTFSRKRTGSVI